MSLGPACKVSIDTYKIEAPIYFVLCPAAAPTAGEGTPKVTPGHPKSPPGRPQFTPRSPPGHPQVNPRSLPGHPHHLYFQQPLAPFWWPLVPHTPPTQSSSSLACYICHSTNFVSSLLRHVSSLRRATSSRFPATLATMPLAPLAQDKKHSSIQRPLVGRNVGMSWGHPRASSGHRGTILGPLRPLGTLLKPF